METEPTNDAPLDPQPIHVIEQLAPYLDNQLADEQRLGVESHLQECEACRARFQELAQSRQEATPAPENPSPEIPAASEMAGSETASSESETLTPESPAPDKFHLPDYEHGNADSEGHSSKAKWAGIALFGAAVVGGAFFYLSKRPMTRSMTPAKMSPPLARPAAPPMAMEKSKPQPASQESLVSTLNDQFGMKKMPAAEKPPKLELTEEKSAPAVPTATPMAPKIASKPVVVAQAPVPQPAKPVLPKAPMPAAHPAVASPAKPPVKVMPTATPVPPAPAVAAAPKDANEAAVTTAADGSPEWKGTMSGITQPLLVVIHDVREWEYLWKAHYKLVGTPTSLPALDFNRYIVVGVYAGQKSSGGASVQITGTETTATSLIVVYKENEGTAGASKTTTQPFHLKAIPRTPLIIQFKKI